MGKTYRRIGMHAANSKLLSQIEIIERKIQTAKEMGLHGIKIPFPLQNETVFLLKEQGFTIEKKDLLLDGYHYLITWGEASCLLNPLEFPITQIDFLLKWVHEAKKDRKKYLHVNRADVDENNLNELAKMGYNISTHRFVLDNELVISHCISWEGE